MELKVFRWTQEEVIWVRNGQGWFQLKFKGRTLHIKVDFTPHNSKVKSHLKFTELDINASPACLACYLSVDSSFLYIVLTLRGRLLKPSSYLVFFIEVSKCRYAISALMKFLVLDGSSIRSCNGSVSMNKVRYEF